MSAFGIGALEEFGDGRLAGGGARVVRGERPPGR